MNTSYTCQTRYKTNTNEEGLVFTTEYVAFLDKDESKVRELDCNWQWQCSIHCDEHSDECEEKDYLVTLNRFFDSKGNVDASIKFYLDGEIDGKPYAWCFYNSEDSLIYKYIINPETCNDINLYYELLKIDNKDLNSLLLKYKDHKEIFDNSALA
jgi:hypothetical protein